MKLNNKGFAISTVMYMILIFALVLIVSILGLLSSRKMTLDKVKESALTKVKSHIFRKTYNVGDKIKVAGEYYYVIAYSPRSQDYVTALKEKPLTVDEVNNNKIGSDGINHVNRYTYAYVGEANTNNGFKRIAQDDDGTIYGSLAYYSSETCGYVNGRYVESECRVSEGYTIGDYDVSDVKQVVDSWSSHKFLNLELKEVNGYKSRLIYREELFNNLDCHHDCYDTKYTWLYNSHYWYWIMGFYFANYWHIDHVDFDGGLERTDPYWGVYQMFMPNGSVRPVINVYKSAIEEETE